jgi:putative (di)nucleoside polyphosphate hydrolase
MQPTATLPYRQNVCMILFNDQKQILLGERFRQAGIWQFPQGGVEAEYSLEENVYRELEEELGLCRPAVEIIKQLEATHRYEWEIPPSHFVNRFIGQEQTFWLVRVSDASKINLVSEEQEFQQVRWLEPHVVLAAVEPVRIKGYQPPLEEVIRYLSSL